MTSFITWIHSNYSKIYFALIGWLVLYALAFVFALMPVIDKSESFFLYTILLLLFVLPVLDLLILGIFALYQALKKERSWLSALMYFLLSLIFIPLFFVAFLLVTFSVFGFS